MDRLLHYEIARQLGEGKNGPSYLAMDAGLQRAVVLKLLERPGSPARNRDARYLADMERIDRLEQVGIVQFYSLEEDNGRLFVVREYVDGTSLADLVRTDPPLHSRILEIAAELTALLKTLHGHNLVHGNLTPANVLVTSEGAIKLADFGLGLPPENWLNAGEASTGDLVYLAPELLSGADATVQSDHYALGAILYMLWTGHPLFSDDTPEALAETIRNEPVSYEVRPARDVPGIARLLLGKLLARDPDDRFVSTDELLFTLQGMMSIGAEPLPEIKRKWTPSPRQYLMLSILAMLLIILWLVVTTDFR